MGSRRSSSSSSSETLSAAPSEEELEQLRKDSENNFNLLSQQIGLQKQGIDMISNGLLGINSSAMSSLKRQDAIANTQRLLESMLSNQQSQIGQTRIQSLNQNQRSQRQASNSMLQLLTRQRNDEVATSSSQEQDVFTAYRQRLALRR